jgi:hypothetical protein
MADDTQHGNPAGHGSYEHEDLSPKSILYFLLFIGIGTIVSIFLLKGVFVFLDKYERATQPPVSPLVTHVPEDTRIVAPGYPQGAFPDPKLEEDERGQLNGIRMKEEQQLYSYGWVDQQAGTVHIPIEHAMDLLVQRGLPVRAQATASMGGDTGGAKTAAESKETGKGTTSGRAN